MSKIGKIGKKHVLNHHALNLSSTRSKPSKPIEFDSFTFVDNVTNKKILLVDAKTSYGNTARYTK